jgi:hypothetical protein
LSCWPNKTNALGTPYDLAALLQTPQPIST